MIGEMGVGGARLLVAEMLYQAVKDVLIAPSDIRFEAMVWLTREGCIFASYLDADKRLEGWLEEQGIEVFGGNLELE